MNILMSYNTNDGYGAIGRYVELTNNLLQKRNIKIFYISPDGYNRSEGKNFFHLGYRKSNFKPNFIYAWFMVILSFIKNHSILKKIDKCILFNGSNAFIFAFLKFIFKYELVYSIRVNIVGHADIDLSLHQYNPIKLYFKKIQYKFLYLLESFIVKKADKIIFQSEVNAEEYKKLYGVKSNKIYILNNNCNPIWIGAKKKLELKKGFNIGFVGNLFMSKGIDIILEAFKLVKKKNSHCFLSIIGDGPNKEYFETYANRLSLSDVTFFGHKKNAFQLMHNFDLIIVPSFIEAFPNVVLESIYYNVPVLASNVGGIPYILEKDCMFKAGDYKTLSKKIINLLNDKNYKKTMKIVNKTRKKFLFDWGNEFYKIIMYKVRN